MQLSPHFSLDEMARTGRADLAETNKKEAQAFVSPLTALCVSVLEVIRAKFGPVTVHSGYRGKTLNVASKGAASSQHCKGEACDFDVPGHTCEEVLEWIVSTSALPFDQVIGETRAGKGKPFGWIHVSHKAGGGNRHEALVSYDGKNYDPYVPSKKRVS